MNEKKSVTQRQKTSSLLKRAFIYLLDENFSRADKYLDKVLDIKPENSMAWLGKLMVEKKVKKYPDLVHCKTPINNSRNYKKAIHFGDEKLKALLKGYSEEINKNLRKRKLRKFLIGFAVVSVVIFAVFYSFKRSKTSLVNFLNNSEENQESNIPESEIEDNFPLPAEIFGSRVDVYQSPNTISTKLKQINAGYPVSIARKISGRDGDWYYVSMLTITQGWIKGDYVASGNSVKRTRQEIENREKTLPSKGIVSGENKTEIHNIPSSENSAKVITEVSKGDEFTAYEIFAEEGNDWYRIRTNKYDEGWISGRFIKLQ